MERKFEIMDALGDVNTYFVEEASQNSPQMKDSFKAKLSTIAASVAFVTVIGTLAFLTSRFGGVSVPGDIGGGPGPGSPGGDVYGADMTETEGMIPPELEEFITDKENDGIDASGETRDPDDTSNSASVEDPDDIVWPGASDVTQFNDDGLINILIVGQDRRSGESRERSDTMILVSINPDTKEVSLISFLRDTYVQIPGGYSDNRLNVAYKFGGFKLLKQTLNLNFGVTIDGCFECDFNDFMEIIDLLGGVEIDVTVKEAKYMRDSMGINISAGKNNFNGEQALAYARIREIDSDFGRTQRQRTILLTLFEKFKNASVSELMAIADEVLPKLATDMTNTEIMGTLAQVLPMMSSLQISQHSVPFEGAYRNATIRNMSVLVPDLEKIRKKLAEEFLPL